MVSRQSVSNQALALFLALFCIGARAAQASIDDQSLMSSVRPTPFPVCIDDSDCLKLGEGNKYACFQVGSFKLSTNQRSASTYLFLHLPISVPTYFSTYLFQYLPISVTTDFSTYLFQYLPNSIQTYFSRYLFQYLHISIPTYFSTHLFQYLPISIQTYFNTNLFQYKPISVPTYGNLEQ